MLDRLIQSQGDRQLCVLAPHPVYHPNEEGERDRKLQVRVHKTQYSSTTPAAFTIP